MNRCSLMSLATAVVGLTLLVGCTERTPRVPETSVPTTPAAPAAAVESTAAVPASQQDSPLLAQIRALNGPTIPYVSIVEAHPTDYHGKYNIVVVRTVSRDSTANFSIYVVDEALTDIVRSVEQMTAPWPDFTVRIDSVTPDSVYLTGRSPGYRRTLLRAYQWWPQRSWTTSPSVRPPLAMAAPVCGDTLRVDLDARTIAGIWMNQTIAAVTREVGAANVVGDTAYAEGEPVPEYTIKLCGHEIRRTWNGVSWRDPVFRTPEGLGVGSPLAAFDTAYGKGEAIGEEGNSVRYWPINGVGHFFVDVSDGCYGHAARRWTVNRACQASGISFTVFEPR